MSAAVLEQAPDETLAPTDADPLDHAYKITLERYMRMVDAGVFKQSERFYLWKGTLVEKMTKYQPHNVAMSLLNRLLTLMIPEGWYLRSEQPISIDEHTVPEPDFAIVRGKPRDFPKLYPSAKDVSLLVEVSDSSLAVDRGGKVRVYADHKIPIYWIVNIPGRQVEVRTEPIGEGQNACYRQTRIYVAEEFVPVVLDGREIGAIQVKELFL